MSPKISAIPCDYFYCFQDLEITMPFYITDLPQSPSSEKGPLSNTGCPLMAQAELKAGHSTSDRSLHFY